MTFCSRSRFPLFTPPAMITCTLYLSICDEMINTVLWACFPQSLFSIFAFDDQCYYIFPLETLSLLLIDQESTPLPLFSSSLSFPLFLLFTFYTFKARLFGDGRHGQKRERCTRILGPLLFSIVFIKFITMSYTAIHSKTPAMLCYAIII